LEEGREWYNPAMAKKPKPSKAKPGARRGPKPELFKVSGMTFEEAATKSFQKKKPAGGWPK
jgi:hypothetical protein